MQKGSNVTILLRPRGTYWLLATTNAGQMETLTIDLDGCGEALAVFGFEEEAGMFSLWAPG